MKPIKIGLVGIGRAGWGIHAVELDSKTDMFEIVAACDVIPKEIKKWLKSTVAVLMTQSKSL